jgi:hypothetical protein
MLNGQRYRLRILPESFIRYCALGGVNTVTDLAVPDF